MRLPRRRWANAQNQVPEAFGRREPSRASASTKRTSSGGPIRTGHVRKTAAPASAKNPMLLFEGRSSQTASAHHADRKQLGHNRAKNGSA